MLTYKNLARRERMQASTVLRYDVPDPEAKEMLRTQGHLSQGCLRVSTALCRRNNCPEAKIIEPCFVLTRFSLMALPIPMQILNGHYLA